MNWDIEKYIIFEAIVGSNVYGTSDEKSDMDLRGVCIPPFDVMLGLLGNFEQKDGWEGKYEDRVIYNIQKFFKMCLSNNPTILEMLFLPESTLITSSSYWERVVEHRNLFISKRVRFTFSGYALSQLHRIKRHRGYLLNPIKEKPTRNQFGLPTNPSLSYEQMSALLTLPLTIIDTKDLREEATNEARHRQAKKDWDDYQSWRIGRNKERAELEEKFGYDVKHASHLVRLMREGEEILRTGFITFPRPEADLLVDVKQGKFSYDRLLEMVDGYDKLFEELYETSEVLPYTPNFKAVDELYLSIIREYYYTNEKGGSKDAEIIKEL